MMTRQEIFKEAMALPSRERAALLKALQRTFEGTIDTADNKNEKRSHKEIIAKRRRAIDRLRGIACVSGKKPPTDEEWREERTNYLLEECK